MAEAKWSGVLSTTEPRNDIGILNVRQGNLNSETVEFQIIQNNKPYDLTGTKVYFCTNFGLSAVQKSAVVKDAINGIITFTFNYQSMQEVGRQMAYFQITKDEVMIDSTQDFEFRIESSILSRKMEAGSYIESFEKVLETLGDNAAYGLTKELQETNELLKQKVGDGVKAEPEDLSSKTLGLITGNGGPINLLTIPQDKSVTPEKATFINTEGIIKTLYSNLYIAGRELTGGVLKNDLTGGRSLIYPVQPNTTYTVSKELSDRFRIAAHTSNPAVGATLSRFIKDEFVSVETDDKSYTFTTKANETYIVVTVSIIGSQPKIHIATSTKTYDFDDLQMTKNTLGKNIQKSKNLFQGNYISAGVTGKTADNNVAFVNNEAYKSAVIKVNPGKTYTISKTDSNRFRIAVARRFPTPSDTDIWFVKDEFDGEGDLDKKFTFTNSRVHANYLIVYVTNGGTAPDFLQVEEGANATEWETYGYKLEPQSTKYSNINNMKSNRGEYNVEEFRQANLNDSQIIQNAFDAAEGHIITFDPTKKYVLESTAIAKAAKVRGINGKNALLRLATPEIAAIKYLGSKTTGRAHANEPLNEQLALTEMNAFLKDLKVTTENQDYIGVGLEIEGMFALRLKGFMPFKMKHGIQISKMNRNLLFSDCNIWDNGFSGIYANEASMHQFVMSGGHIAYNKRGIYVNDSDIHNFHLLGVDIESGPSNGYVTPESLIHFHLSADTDFVYEAIVISGGSLQDHDMNVAAMLKFESEKEDGFQDLNIATAQLGNSVKEALYVKNAKRLTVNGITLKGGQAPNSIVLDGKIKDTRIVGSHLTKGVSYNPANVGKLIIANNTTEGFTLEDYKDEKVTIANNM